MAARKIIVDEFVHATRSCMSVLQIQRWYRRTIIQRAERFQRRRELAALTIQVSDLVEFNGVKQPYVLSAFFLFQKAFCKIFISTRMVETFSIKSFFCVWRSIWNLTACFFFMLPFLIACISSLFVCFYSPNGKAIWSDEKSRTPALKRRANESKPPTRRLQRVWSYVIELVQRSITSSK